MARYRNTIMAFIILLIFIVVSILLDKGSPTQNWPGEVALPIDPITVDNIDSINLTESGVSIKFYADEEKWWIDGDEKVLADQQLVSNLAESLSNMEVARLASDNLKNMADYGISDTDSARSIEIRFPASKTVLFHLGSKDRHSNGQYINLDLDSNIYLLKESIPFNIGKNYWLNKKILDVDISKINNFVLTHSSENLKFNLIDGQWELESQVNMNQEKFNNFWSAITTLEYLAKLDSLPPDLNELPDYTLSFNNDTEIWSIWEALDGTPYLKNDQEVYSLNPGSINLFKIKGTDFIINVN